MRFPLLLAIVALSACTIERGAQAGASDTVHVTDTLLRVDTIVRTDTVHVIDTLVSLGDRQAAAEATQAAPAAKPASPAPASSAVAGSDVDALAARRLAVPVAGVRADGLPDTFNEMRGSRRHEALDIMASRGTPVLSADDGRVIKLFTSTAGGLTIYATDPAERFIYYYAHLDRYRDGLAEGMPLRKGEQIAFVGSTGNASASAPHLHFAIARATTVKRWWEGAPIDPTPVLKGVGAAGQPGPAAPMPRDTVPSAKAPAPHHSSATVHHRRYRRRPKARHR